MSGDALLLDDDFFRRFRAWETSELGHSPVTAHNYIRQSGWLLDWARGELGLRRITLPQVTEDLIRAWLAHAEERGLAKRTRKGVVLSLRALFTFAGKVLHYDGPNAAREVRYPKVHRMEYPHPFRASEIRAVMDLPLPAWDGRETTKRQRLIILRDKWAFRFLLETGARVGGFTRATVADVDPEIHLLEKGARERDVHLGPSLLEATRWYLGEVRPYFVRDDDGRLWCGRNATGKAPGRPGDSLGDALKRLCLMAGVEGFRPHRCRATAARVMFRRGVPLRAIQTQLGHADVSTTLGYIAVLDDEEAKAIDDVFQDRWWESGTGI